MVTTATPPVDDRMQAATWAGPGRIPGSVGILPAAWMKHRGAMDAIVRRYPEIFGAQPAQRDYDHVWSDTYHYGDHVDKWGCVWENVQEGMEAIVRRHPYPSRESVRALKPPALVDGSMPHGFMFLRLTDLRGFEECMVDFAEEPPELEHLVRTVFEHNLKELEVRLAKTSPQREPFMGFGDDLGMQHALPMRPRSWRRWLKPCYAEFYRRVHAAGHKVYMHTDGKITDIIPDLIECGVDVLNPQFRANGLDGLARTCTGKVCIDLDLDRQMFPFVGPRELEAHIAESIDRLGGPTGGLWLKAEIGYEVPLANVEAICQSLLRHRDRFVGPQAR